MGNAKLASNLSAKEYAGQVKARKVPFSSAYGSGQVPLLLEIGGRERGIYVEAGKWDWTAIDRCHRWLAVLRASERKDLEVDVRSVEAVPEAVSFYLGMSPRVLFELAGLAACRWVGVAGFAGQNAAALRRLAREHLGFELGEGEASLEALDRLVVEVLRPDGQILPSTLILLGSHFGEVLLARYGGRWLVQGDGLEDVVVEVPSVDGHVQANVFGKVMKLFQNGMEDSTAWMAEAMAGDLGRQ